MAIASFKDLLVWQKSKRLVTLVYDVTRQLPANEKYALADQMQRAAISIPSNIAEGSKRSSRPDFRQFARIASGSAAELETQLLITVDLYPAIDVSAALQLLEEVQKMLSSLISRLSQPINYKLNTIN